MRTLGEREVCIEMRLDVLEHLAQSPGRQRTTGLDLGCMPRLQSKQAHRERAGQAIRE
jgi:hypothetical protein